MGGLRKAAHYFLNSGMCYLNYSVLIFAWLTGLKFLRLVHLIWSPKRLCQKDTQSYVSHYLIKLCINFFKSLIILFSQTDSRKSYLTIMYVLDHYNSVKQICEFPRTVEWTLLFIIWSFFQDYSACGMSVVWTKTVVMKMKRNEWLHDIYGVGTDRIYTWIIWGVMAEGEIKDYSLILARWTGRWYHLWWGN